MNQKVFTQLLPTKDQLDIFKNCKDLVQGALALSLKKNMVLNQSLDYKVHGLMVLVMYQIAEGQEIDFDYGCYLPENCFSGDQENDAEVLIGHVKQCLSQLCFNQNWQLDDTNPSCLRIRGFMADAHFDIPCTPFLTICLMT
ncbi:cyclic GMP-AMP synthase DncV-like nucleotidyltransferase [Psychrobacter sp. ER1]|uniref:cyclic GMP-AMP synthase DncV-like nucleotidyltransferase n=1 Tax=Psychrobacter sp. ER1 TaxID=3406645 RepID=UPI003B43B352